MPLEKIPAPLPKKKIILNLLKTKIEIGESFSFSSLSFQVLLRL